MFTFLWLLAFRLLQITPSISPAQNELEEMYWKAMELYYAEHPTFETDSLAKAFLSAIANAKDKDLGKVELLDVYEKLGNLNLMAEQNRMAIAAYWSALSMEQYSDLEDSLFFSPNLFLGEAYYKINKPDSAVYFFKRAESIFNVKKSKNEGSRLYNSLGVYYYETGNFNQAINYFTKAKDLVIGDLQPAELNTYLKYAYFSFESNIATALVKLTRLDSAKKVFIELIQLNVNNDKTLLDLVDLHLELGEPGTAQNYLQKIVSPTARQSIGFLNKLAEIHFQNQDFLIARNILQELIAKYEASEQDFLDGERNLKLGYSHRLLGKVFLEENNFHQALFHFHHAILHFDPGFSNLDPMSNPDDHAMGFAAYALFDNLILKAKTLVNLANVESGKKHWEAAINTYQEAFNKVFYLNAFYDNDLARMFLGESVLPAYKDAIEQVIEKNAISPHYPLLEQAFLWAESSKSISLLAGKNEKKDGSQFGIPETLLEEERELNFELSNLIQQINTSDDQELIRSLQKELRDLRLQLSRLHLRFNEFPTYISGKSKGKVETIKELQTTLLPKQVLLISVFESDKNRHLFYVGKNSLTLTTTPLDEAFAEKVTRFKNSIYSAKLGERFDQADVAKEIYMGFFSGAEEKLGDFEELLIIPHGIWRDFPFDLMVDSSNRYLIERFAIGYQFSANFLASDGAKLASLDNMLSLAPYAHAIENSAFDDLPYSLSEIMELPGKKLIGKAATKSRFFDLIGNHNILHLATHAQAFLEAPYQSYIAFYPDSADFKLYLEELQYKRFEHTDLIYLSSCESNYGEISDSEGVLGISRAFAYAGCPNIVTSLWEMEDLTSSYLSSRFYDYLGKGNSIAKALQMAKLDLLADPQMNQFRHPRYWAQLVYIGDPLGLEVERKWHYVLSILLIIPLAFLIYRLKKHLL